MIITIRQFANAIQLLFKEFLVTSTKLYARKEIRHMNVLSLIRSLNRQQRSTFIASFLGWSLDAFDFFLLTFVTLRIAKEFGVGLPAVALTVTLTLVMRPFGALIFGLFAERF